MQVARHLGIRVLGTDREAKRAHIEAQGGILIDFEHEDVVERVPRADRRSRSRLRIRRRRRLRASLA